MDFGLILGRANDPSWEESRKYLISNDWVVNPIPVVTCGMHTISGLEEYTDGSPACIFSTSTSFDNALIAFEDVEGVRVTQMAGAHFLPSTTPDDVGVRVRELASYLPPKGQRPRVFYLMDIDLSIREYDRKLISTLLPDPNLRSVISREYGMRLLGISSEDRGIVVYCTTAWSAELAHGVVDVLNPLPGVNHAVALIET